MQPIKDKKVKLRFKRFKKFMEDTTKKDLDDVKGKLDAIRQSIDQIQPFEESIYSDVFDEISEKNKTLSTGIKTYIESLEKRKKEFLTSIESKRDIPLRFIKDCPKRKIYKTYVQFGEKAKELEGSEEPGKLEELKAQYTELNSKKLLFLNKKQLIKYLEDIKNEEKYNNCIEEISKRMREATIKGKDIISSELSPQLKKLLEKELNQLGGSGFRVFFKVTGEKGTTEHQLHLAGIKQKIPLCDILSEGEQHVIAIAGFLAELQISNNGNPIVFDDPVCSLDHNFRRKIAMRLAKESKIRQVIIFTHDLSFLMMLKDYCEKYNSDISVKSIERISGIPGICTDHMPWDAANVKERIGLLKEECGGLKIVYKKGSQTEYKLKAILLYGHIRETWERLVEELLLNGIVYRFARDIQTKRLKRLTDIQDGDYKIVDNAMKKCSVFLHDKSPDLNEDIPDPSEIMSDIDELEKYSKELKTKRKRSPRG